MKCHCCHIEYATPEYDEAIALREEVLRKPLQLEFSTQQLAAEYNQVHLGAYDDEGSLLACLTFEQLDTTTLKMRQVAVSPLLQHKGIGKQLVHYAETWARQKGFTTIQLHARDTALPFYRQLAYLPYGEPFTEVTIPHQAMAKKLAIPDIES